MVFSHPIDPAESNSDDCQEFTESLLVFQVGIFDLKASGLDGLEEAFNTPTLGIYS